jgi:ATP-dependent helicase HrpA
MPLSDPAEIIIREMPQTDLSLFEALAKFAKKKFQVDIPAAEWAKAEIPPHLKLRVAITDHEGRNLAAGRDLDELKKAASESSIPEDSAEWRGAKEKWGKENLTSWDFGDLPESIAVGPFMTAYPALEATEKGINLRIFRNREEALSSHEPGIEALLLLRFAKDLEFMARYLVLPEEYEKTALYFGGRSAVEKSMLESLRREVFRRNLRTREEFEAYAGGVVQALYDKGHILWEAVLQVFNAYEKTRRTLQNIEASSCSSHAIAAVCQQVRDELQALAPKNFVEKYPLERLGHLPRYLKALEVRAERAKNDPEKDRRKAEQARPFLEAQRRLEESIQTATSLEKKKAVVEFRWMVEEFKVSLFAPELKTAFPVSAKRLALKLKEIS